MRSFHTLVQVMDENLLHTAYLFLLNHKKKFS